jgi:hypothetical protein
MNQPTTIRFAAVMSILLLAVGLGSARAQEAVAASAGTQASPQGQKGPLVFETVKNVWVAAPEVKFTNVSDHFGTMVGGYAGVLLDESFLVGAAGYWLADGSYDRGLGYGGLVLGYFAPLGKAARFGARGLIGGGSGTTNVSYTYVPQDGSGWGHGHDPYPPFVPGQPVTRQVIYSTGFFVAEPQASFILKLADWIAIDASAGYRLVAWSNGLDDHFRGPVGSIAIRFGGQ